MDGCHLGWRLQTLLVVSGLNGDSPRMKGVSKNRISFAVPKLQSVVAGGSMLPRKSLQGKVKGRTSKKELYFTRNSIETYL